MAGIMLATFWCPLRPGDKILLERPQALPSSKKRDGSSPILLAIHGSWSFMCLVSVMVVMATTMVVTVINTGENGKGRKERAAQPKKRKRKGCTGSTENRRLSLMTVGVHDAQRTEGKLMDRMLPNIS